ncbi:MAG TPA: hypothetical protein VFW87_08405 [Pirellulales bacterium]|nr:hypothetical protein [Pirellulales bacterium]
MENHQLLFEEVTDPTLIARSRVAFALAKLNSDWLAAHWPDLLPSARGQYVAVAGQEALIAGTAQEAWRRAEQAHPEDSGVFVKYVVATEGPRIYANRR